MILVTGATGNVGGEVVHALSERGERVRAMSRHSPEVALSGVEYVSADLADLDSVRPALEGARGIFLLGGYADPATLMAACTRAGVRRVVLLSSSSVNGASDDNLIGVGARAGERAVRESGLAWTILRPNGFMANLLRWRTQLRHGDVISGPFPEIPVALVHPADIGAVAAEALTTDTWNESVLPVTGPEPLLPREQAEVLGQALCRPLTYRGLFGDDARAMLAESMSPEYADAIIALYSGQLNEARVSDTVRKVTGRGPLSLSEWVTSHLPEFQS